MQMSFKNLECDGERVDLTCDFSSASCRLTIKLLHENPDLLRCLYQNLEHFEQYVGYDENIRVTAEVDKVLKGIFK